MLPVQLTTVDEVAIPALSAASAVTSLNVEPGGYCPEMARFCKGCCGLLRSSSHCLTEMPPEKTDGSKVGRLTIASTSPVLTSMATAAPLSSPNAASAACCN